jgi:hypothetical protein
MIWNKSLSVHTLVYDMAQNVLYEDNDVDVVLQNDEGMAEFLADSIEKVKPPADRNKKNKSEAKTQVAEQLGIDDDFYGYMDYDFRSMRGLRHRFEYQGG